MASSSTNEDNSNNNNSTNPENITSGPFLFSLSSYDTALALVPDRKIASRLDHLRSLYDKAYPKWPPHINLFYPFVKPEFLSRATELIAESLSSSTTTTTTTTTTTSSNTSSNTPPPPPPPPRQQKAKWNFDVTLDKAGVFERSKNPNTVYLTSSSTEELERVRELRTEMLRALGHGEDADAEGGRRHPNHHQFTMHMTIGQSDDVSSAAHKYLVDKVARLPRSELAAGNLCVLVRERDQKTGETVMKIWGRIRLEKEEEEGGKYSVERVKDHQSYWYGPETFQKDGRDDDYDDDLVNDDEEEEKNDEETKKQVVAVGRTEKMMAHYFDEEMDRWIPFGQNDSQDFEEEEIDGFVVASWNVLAEFEYPPSEARYPCLVRNILSEQAGAHVLVLEEVTDSFLEYLLRHPEIREKYPFCSHGPPEQDDMEPLPSFLNVVVLSTISFDWEYVSFRRKHKGALVATFKHVARQEADGKSLPTVLAGVHLSHGLTDGAVASKKADIKRLIGYLSDRYPENAWIVAGDFNITTSRNRIQAALEKKDISDVTAAHLASFDRLFEDANLEDAWKKTEDGVDGGEQGTTWNPNVNGMAAAMAANGGNFWPQRYDRILVRTQRLLRIRNFNQFGFLKDTIEGGPSEPTFPSDHWGVRCKLDVGDFGEKPQPAIQQPSEEISKLVVPVHLQEAEGSLAELGSVQKCLTELGAIPGQEETAHRKKAFDLLKSVILDTWAIDGSNPKSQPTVVVIPVGSYALGVWTSSSDIDVLVIGPFTANTFFSLAAKRLRKAGSQGVKILRRIRANTGTMLELDVTGIRMDLQFCPATSVAEQWPQVLHSPPSNPVWSLPSQTLNKLKAIRDIDYIQRTIPSIPAFQLAHRLIKTWAKSRGIYSARFGFLSGIQIAILLTRVYKLLALSHKTAVSVESLLTTFFAHYATFPFSTHQAFDPTYHTSRIPYTRVATREPLAILGYFPPMLNTATSASIPSVRTLSQEFLLAHQSLSEPNMSWHAFLTSPPAPFMSSFKTYISLSLQYWSLSPSKGLSYLGWFESRCVALLVDLSRKSPLLHARMYPARFIERSELENPDEYTRQGRSYRGCYLIGLDRADPQTAKEDLKASLAALRSVLPRFEETIRGDSKYFDPATRWMAASLVSQAEMQKMDLVIDRTERAEQNAGEEEDDDDDEDDDDSSDEDQEQQQKGEAHGRYYYDNDEADSDDRQEGESWESIKRRRREKKKADKAAANKRGVVSVVDLRTDKTKKFRTASDVINRIRWDASMDSGDFVVGYEDRFLGAQEKNLDEWKGEQTDEEFIPQHRILYFKRKSDARIIWDRRTRWDEIFDHNNDNNNSNQE